MNEIDSKIGALVRRFVSTEFIISDISYKLKITNHKMKFFADFPTGEKIKKLIIKFQESELENKEDYIELLENFIEIGKSRNELPHSLILFNSENEEELRLHDYKVNKGIITNNSKTIFSTEIDKINDNVVQVHNSLCKLVYE